MERNPVSRGRSRADGLDLQEHAPWLFARLLKQVSAAVAAADVDGLRASHLRLLSVVPPEGAAISVLAAQVAMTKQSCGQFVTHLVATGHLVTTVDAGDRRSRVVLRTAAGDAAAARFVEVVAAVERRWASVLGADGWSRLRADLTTLLQEDRPS